MQVDKVNSTNNVSFPCQPLKEDEKLAELKQKPDVFESTEKYDPIKAYKKLDTITLTSEIVENTIFSNLQYFSPILIILIMVGTFHNEFSSGMFKNYLLRTSYKTYLKKLISLDF